MDTEKLFDLWWNLSDKSHRREDEERKSFNEFVDGFMVLFYENQTSIESIINVTKATSIKPKYYDFIDQFHEEFLSRMNVRNRNEYLNKFMNHINKSYKSKANQVKLPDYIRNFIGKSMKKKF